MNTSLVNTFDTKEDFFKITPELIHVSEFKELKRLNKEYNKILWYVALFADPHSKFSNLEKNNRHEKLSTTIPIPSNFERAKLEQLIEVYFSMAETPIMRQLRMWKEKLDEKLKFIQNTAYSEETYEMLIKLEASNVKAFTDYEQIMKKLEKDEGKSMGGGEKSLSDKGALI